ncbi:hypothetical protein MPSEU_000059100 [Mayamaea pseudoterrestris]|nr:hypothetical protein MPSEU_000059100 [Mayamaea pseudoterrestris]
MSSSRRLMDAVASIRELDAVKEVSEGGNDGRSYICHNCAKEDDEYPMPMQCARCKMVWYCSHACMKSAYAEHVGVCNKSKDLDVSMHTKKKYFDILPDGRKLSELLRIKKKKEELQPLSMEELEAEPGLYQIPDMADAATSHSSIKVTAVDERHHKFKPVTAGTLFRYRESDQLGASWVEKKKNSRLGAVYNFYGKGKLTVTFTSKQGSKQTIHITPKKPTPPTLEIQQLGNGVLKVVASEDCVLIKCQDAQGNRFKKALTCDSLFRYEAATKVAKAKSLTEANHGIVKLIKGFGDLKITASESTGLTTFVTVPPR